MATHYDWGSLYAALAECRACPLAQGRTHAVIGTGNPHGKIMLVGEGPGRDEDATGVPFVGRAGQLLDKMLAHVGLSRQENLYITNMVKCRPPQNRDPEKEEVAACIGFLRNQVHLIRPKVIVCLGRVAACALIDPAFKVTRQHGIFYEKNGFLMMGTFHPAALLRNPRQKPEGLEDLIALRQLLDRQD